MNARFFTSVLCLSLLLTLGACHRSARNSAPSETERAARGDSLTFLVFGDWGKYGGQQQQAVADRMDIVGRHHGIRFIISTGDNFYYAGVRNTSDRHWQASFEEVYNRSGHQVPWYPVLGNHDYGTNPQAQIEYSALSERWRMPARYHSLKQRMGDGYSALFLFTDTSPLVNANHGNRMGDLDQQDTAAQRRWLADALSDSKDTWKIVIGHHPVYSAGPHRDTRELIGRFEPIFLQTRTDFYLAGHDHSLQHLHRDGDPVHYLVSGGGSEATRIHRHPHARFTRSSTGFLIMTLYRDRATAYFYNKNGRLLYRNDFRR
ncbi:tartrate-resistant acid phosphatase type 5 family protein [Flaviaesturariibacter amylovorans]|uniref:acid phosphatase n=1 Tax=Flaviaesturariibacter amylovorans TaxID=1084520 RepID=A0ABP8GGM6_9BACT